MDLKEFNFSNNLITSLDNVQFPDNLESIDCSLNNIQSFENIKIPKGLKQLVYSSFDENPFEKVVFPNGFNGLQGYKLPMYQNEPNENKPQELLPKVYPFYNVPYDYNNLDIYHI